jgi:hypothetical protein
MFILWLVWWLLGIFTYASSSSWRLIGNCEECLSSTPSVEACTYLELSLTYVPPPVHDFRLIDYVIVLLSFSYWVIYYYWTFEHSPQSTILTQPHVNTVLESPHTNTWTEFVGDIAAGLRMLPTRLGCSPYLLVFKQSPHWGAWGEQLSVVTSDLEDLDVDEKLLG